MSEWLVKLEGHEFDLQELSRQLTRPALSVTKDENGFWLRSTRFEALEEARDVLAAAEALLVPLNGAGRLFATGFKTVVVNHIQRFDGAGNWQVFMFDSGTVTSRFHASGADTFNGETSTPTPAEPSIMSLAVVQAEQDGAVQRALRIFGSREHDWVNLYRVFEIIQADIGGAIAARGWMTKGEIDRFKHTANSVGVVGDDARHGAEHTQPPKNPMRLEEAQALIRNLFLAWLSAKRPSS